MKVFVYLDESGSIHKNSKTSFFAVGGYIVFENEKNKITSMYKSLNKKIKDNRNIEYNREIKSYDMNDSEKVEILSKMEELKSFYGCVKVFDKHKMKKEIVESNIFFNYAVKILFKDCILPLLKSKRIKENILFIVSVDNRNIRVGELNNLETYLQTEFCLENIDFKITYYDSSFNYGIQLADLVVNTFYNSYKDRKIVEQVLPCLKASKYKVSLFPGYIKEYKISKFTYTTNEII